MRACIRACVRTCIMQACVRAYLCRGRGGAAACFCARGAFARTPVLEATAPRQRLHGGEHEPQVVARLEPTLVLQHRAPPEPLRGVRGEPHVPTVVAETPKVHSLVRRRVQKFVEVSQHSVPSIIIQYYRLLCEHPSVHRERKPAQAARPSCESNAGLGGGRVSDSRSSTPQQRVRVHACMRACVRANTRKNSAARPIAKATQL